MIEREPLAEVLDGFIGRTPVERHHQTGPAWRARNLRAKVVRADGGYLDAVRAAIDGFVEALFGHGGRQHSARPPHTPQAKGQTKTHPHAAWSEKLDERPKKFR